MNNEAMIGPELDGVAADLVARADREGLRDHVLFATSGSSGKPKWAALSRDALECSALAVNRALEVTADDVWLRALTDLHVGGFAVGLRAKLAGAGLREFTGKWDPARFAAEAEGATLCSLVPTQVFDLVTAGLHPAKSLRTVLVGGAALPDALRQRAAALGWPLRASYGLTEAGSTVALGDGGGSMHLLDIWQGRISKGDELEIAGPALFTKYLGGEGAGEWFATGDRVQLSGERDLVVLGRVDAVVKIMGERVDIAALEAQLPDGFAIVPLPDERRGHLLVLAGEGDGETLMETFNGSAAGYERLAEFVPWKVPKTALGKVRRSVLTAQICDRTSEA